VEPSDRHSYLVIARIVRARGIRGEVLAEIHTDFPARFHLLEKVWLSFADQRRRLFALEDTWEHKGRIVIKFQGIDSVSQAEELRGAWVEIEAENAVSLPEGTYFDHELSGCTVVTAEGRVIGVVREVFRIPGNNQLVVDGGPAGEILIPAHEGICRSVSVSEKRIIVELPEGLLDLNR
jgi:16S rRNA processing protein RimM